MISKEKQTVKLFTCEDNCALYINGKLVEEGEIIDWGEFPVKELVKKLGAKFSQKEVNGDWFEWVINSFYEWPKDEENVVTKKRWTIPEEE